MDEFQKQRFINFARISLKLVKKAQQVGEALENMDNPFIGNMKQRIDKRETFVNDFANYLHEKALATVESGEPDCSIFCTENNTEWLLNEVDKILEMDQWESPNVSRLAALCFFLLGTGANEESAG